MSTHFEAAIVAATWLTLTVPALAQSANPAADTTPTGVKGAGTPGAGLGGAGIGGTGLAEPGIVPPTEPGTRPTAAVKAPPPPTDSTSTAVGTAIGTAK